MKYQNNKNLNFIELKNVIAMNINHSYIYCEMASV